jgi:uncharacterized membrane protein YfcA
MITLHMIPGAEINLFLIIFLSLAAGVISGFVGVGGGFIMTPALIILGFPAQFAVGTSLIWVMGNSIIGTLRHRQLGNVDIKLGILLMVFTTGGVEIGVRVLNWTRDLGLADTAVLITSICILLTVGGYTFWESARTKAKLDNMARGQEKSSAAPDLAPVSSAVQRLKIPPVIYFSKSEVKISLWVLLVIGLVAGILAGFIGVGGGFIIVPSLIYLVGVPSFTAVGTSLCQIIFPAMFGSIRHTLSGNVIIFAAFIMLLGSSAGIYFGALATRYLREVSMRYILASTILVAVAGSILKLINIFSESTVSWLDLAMSVVTFGGLGLVTVMVIGLFVAAIYHQNGKRVPAWLESLVMH